MNQYTYKGPVLYFDDCIASNWSGSTYAVSEDKARNNLTHRFKKENNYAKNAMISLPGKMILVDSGRYSYGRV